MVGKKRVMNHLFSNPISDQKYIWKYIYTLRHVEYHFNNKGIYHILMSLYYRWLLREYSYKTGSPKFPNTWRQRIDHLALGTYYY